jgi:hypothetical protein
MLMPERKISFHEDRIKAETFEEFAERQEDLPIRKKNQQRCVLGNCCAGYRG